MSETRATVMQPIYSIGSPEPVAYMYNNGRWVSRENGRLVSRESEQDSLHAELQGLTPIEDSFVNEPALRNADIVDAQPIDPCGSSQARLVPSNANSNIYPWYTDSTTFRPSSHSAVTIGTRIDTAIDAGTMGPATPNIDWQSLFELVRARNKLFVIRDDKPADIVMAVEWITEDWGINWPEKVLAISYDEAAGTIILTTSEPVDVEPPYGYIVKQKGPNGQTHQVANPFRRDPPLLNVFGLPFNPTLGI